MKDASAVGQEVELPAPEAEPSAFISACSQWLGRPVDVASLAVFRILFGGILLWEVSRYFSFGWIPRYFVEPEFAFKYPGFGWVEALPEPGLQLHFALLGLLAAGIALGAAFRWCAGLFCLCFLYVFLLEQARYLNHFYLILLLSFLLACSQADRDFSVAKWRRPARTPPWVPRWQLCMLQAQIGIAYFYAGLAKLNPDWLAGEPMRSWLARRGDYAVVGPYLGEEWAVALFSYGGLLFDLCVFPALMWKRTRPLAIAAAIVFHLTNAWLFRIGIFPWLMLAAMTLFLEPSWPRHIAARLRSGDASDPQVTPPPFALSRWLLVGLAGYLALQLALPLRHHLYPGWVHWTEEGHYFSWRMMLREKRAHGAFAITDEAGQPIGVVDPELSLPAWQADALLFRPELIRQFAHHIAARTEEREGRPVKVYARITASLNGRDAQYLVDPHVDLSGEPYRLGHAPWIRELKE